MNKLQMIRLQNIDGDDVIELEIVASKKGTMPAISRPEFKGDTILELFYDENKNDKFKNEEAKNKLDELVNVGSVKFNEKTYKNPHITYEDITEKLILGGKAIKMESLKSQEHGLWSMSGRRKFEIIFDNTDCFTKIESIKQTDIRIVFDKLNGELCDYRDFATEESMLKGKQTIIELDTDMFDDAFRNGNENKKRIKLGGYIEVICQYGHGQEIRYKYPIELYVINTNPNVCDCVSELPASIDFGTSSTCVAIERNNKSELLTLSPMRDKDDDNDEGGNIFENPTNIMIFDWDALYEEWKNDNVSAPIVNKGGRMDYLKSIKDPEEFHNVEFDSGYSVKSILGSEFTERKELNSILTLIKMIPYQILVEEQQLEINPYNDKDKFINIICDVKQQSDSCFNPVAFYGYLIGRAINDISKHEDIYTQFQITCPVMFDDRVKEVLRLSLEYGLSRSVPKRLRDSVEVTITHTEPVAYIGALCGTEYFQIEEGEQKMFAVFDFGGGTLDFSYGIVSNEDELKIEVIKVGGKDNFGGETLIENVAYQIYLYNSTLKDNMIPFVQPYGEELPDDVDERLVKKSDYAKANMNIVSAKIARRIFEGKLDTNGENEAFKNLELYNMDGVRNKFSVNYDVSELEETLRKIIINSVSDFAVTLKDAFEGRIEKFDVNDVYIFKAGNSSRSRFVDEGMKQNFPDNKHIQLVDQSTDGRKPKRYSITPKTAVAIGQLKLNRIEVVGDNDFFKFYVGFFNEGTGRFNIVLDRSHNDGVWHRFRKVKNDALDIQYATSKPNDSSTVSRKTIKTVEQKGKIIFIRVKNQTTIEYCFGDFDDSSMIKDDAMEIFEMDLR